MTRLEDLPLVVIDTSCYVHFLTNQNPENAERVEALIENHEKTHLIVVPTVVELETFGKVQAGADGRYGNQPTKRQEQLLSAREWFVSQRFLPAELDRRTVRTALQLMHDHGFHGMDASIIASGLAYDAGDVYTFDRKMIRVGNDVQNITIKEPPPSGTLFPLADTN